MRCYVPQIDDPRTFERGENLPSILRRVNWRWKRRHLSCARLRTTFGAATQFLFFAVAHSPAFLLNSLYANDRTTIKTGRRLRGRRGKRHVNHGMASLSTTSSWLHYRIIFTPAVYHESLFFHFFFLLLLLLLLLPTAGFRHPPLKIRL